ncbi:aldo/keto reductase [Erysipelothrix rhusiopathiae]|uniref:aldo/keto reductase n=1 Tax=Erysipelothrix sp. strain 2 (EsS2-7-Brazil) TaxID=2500579 RepID=UPI0013778EC5|nr:aldo/keto reductase [Erysipelothrix sp. strain 2 (EsS2-7-Brazil)]MBK2404760.1 aldo/keto reductase [Erysipelothrix sp. strain 2 (EsS2-7-Brazil)]NBA01325.1 aldo/keto reductase [Erysipelothrix rhusiopathiae]
MKFKKLRNGTTMPMLGLGTYRLVEDDAYQIVSKALELGYRHIDTAMIYNNEVEVGRAIKDSGIPREELFITTKCWNEDQGYESALQAFDLSLKKLGLDYVDLYLIHWPQPASCDTWRAFEEIYRNKRAKAIGVSNFNVEQLEILLEEATVIPMVNQIERHPYLVQEELKKVCDRHNIACEGWMPIARNKVSESEAIVKLAQKYHKTPAQITLRWQIQTDWIVFPKTQSFERLEENFDIFDFELTNAEVDVVNNHNENLHLGTNPNKYKIK